MNIEARLLRAEKLRAAVSDAVSLVACARRVLDATPAGCRQLVAFCPEGHAVGAAASALALGEGRELPVHLASHLAPLDPGPAAPTWTWMSVEEALGLGPVRPWVRRWAEQRGGVALNPGQRAPLSQVA